MTPGGREHPILFSGPMVRAILAGTKSQTRRVVRPGPPDDYGVVEHPHGWRYEGVTYEANRYERCPYGVPGDRLWVRETWAPRDAVALEEAGDGDFSNIFYRADDPNDYDTDGPWRPSIFMPRALSRITLEVTAVRVERLQDISEADAIAEGMPCAVDGDRASQPFGPIALMNFARGWDALNAKRGYGWAVNPWVWVVSFAKLAEG